MRKGNEWEIEVVKCRAKRGGTSRGNLIIYTGFSVARAFPCSLLSFMLSAASLSLSVLCTASSHHHTAAPAIPHHP